VIALIGCSQKACLFFVANSEQRNQILKTLDRAGMTPSSILRHFPSMAFAECLSLVAAGILKLIVTTDKVH
jgi:hypothetical protein